MERRSVIIILSGFVLAFSLITVAFKVVWPWRGKSKGLLARLCQLLRCRTAKPEEEEEVERRVQEELMKRHLGRAGTFLLITSVATVYFSTSTLVSAALRVQEPPLLMLFTVHFNLVTKCTLCFLPSLWTPRVIDALYLQSLVSLIMSMNAGPRQFVAWRATRLVQFVFWCFLDLKLPLNVFGTLSMIVAEVAMSFNFGVPIEPMLIFAYVSAFFALFGIYFCLEQGVRYEILATDSKSELTAIQTLLDSICDVVVHLDNQLRLKQHTPKLADVLMRSTARSLKGADLRDYMATDEDREAFSNNVTIKDGQTAQANVFHARLRDSTNTNVAMEFFTVDFTGRDGAQHHIVGMREHTDIQPLAGQQRVPPPPPPVRVVIPRRLQEEARSPAPSQRGTPSVTQQWDLRSHRNSDQSDSGSEGESSVSFSLRAESPGGTRGIVVRTRETTDIAKVVTTNYLLMSWVLGAAARCSCCPKHAAIADLRRIADKVAKGPCAPDYGPVTDWQCRRCGIKADEHRDHSHRRRCLLCKSIDDACFEPGAGGGTGPSSTNAAL